jgi:hypothetical protein
MKRFDAAYIRHQLHRLFVASMLAVAALALLGKAAHAQPCGVIDEQPEEVLTLTANELALLFPLPEAECAKLTKGAVSACRKAVSDTLACLDRQLKSFAKSAKIACSVQGDMQEACDQNFEEEVAGAAASFAEDAALADAGCLDEFAEQISSVCLVP